jgi:tRNA(adenine34) deaminase
MSFPLPEPMRLALDEARAAATAGEVPVGAVVTKDGVVLGIGRNRMRADNDPSAHAEMVALRAAARAVGDWRLDVCDLWVTLEHCGLCAGAIALARLSRLYFGAGDPKGGAVLHGPRLFGQPTCHHVPEIYPDIGGSEAGELLQTFFRERRT